MDHLTALLEGGRPFSRELDRWYGFDFFCADAFRGTPVGTAKRPLTYAGPRVRLKHDLNDQ